MTVPTRDSIRTLHMANSVDRMIVRDVHPPDLMLYMPTQQVQTTHWTCITNVCVYIVPRYAYC
jgi:hypothetical protein